MTNTISALEHDEVERRLIAAFGDARSTIVEHPDLFARIELTIEAAADRRRFRRRLAAALGAFVAANAALALVLSYDQGRLTMPWWVIEVITNIVLVAIAVALGPFIKRFGRSYAADVFRSNPRTGKSYLVLTDVAYYLIFAAFILFTVRFEQADNWVTSRASLLQHELARVGGILLIMGLLHTANVVALPIIGGLLSGTATPRRDRDQRFTNPPIGPGTWLLQVAAVPPSGSPEHEAPDPDGNYSDPSERSPDRADPPPPTS